MCFNAIENRRILGCVCFFSGTGRKRKCEFVTDCEDDAAVEPRRQLAVLNAGKCTSADMQPFRHGGFGEVFALTERADIAAETSDFG